MAVTCYSRQTDDSLFKCVKLYLFFTVFMLKIYVKSLIVELCTEPRVGTLFNILHTICKLVTITQ